MEKGKEIGGNNKKKTRKKQICPLGTDGKLSPKRKRGRRKWERAEKDGITHDKRSARQGVAAEPTRKKTNKETNSQRASLFTSPDVYLRSTLETKKKKKEERNIDVYH